MWKNDFFKRLFVCFLAAMILAHQQQALSQALPVAPAANYVVNRAVGGMITKVALQRGFAANDPRIVATMAGVSSSMTAVNVASTVGGVALAIAGAPVWLSVLGGLGIVAVGAAIVAGTTSIKFENGKVIVDAGATSPPAYTNPAVSGLNPRLAQLLSDGSRVYRPSAGCNDGLPCAAFPYAPSPGSSMLPFRRDSLCGIVGQRQDCPGVGPLVVGYLTFEEFVQHYFDGEYFVGPNGSGNYTRQTRKFDGLPALTWDTAGNGSISGRILITSECREGSPTGPNCSGYPINMADMFWSANDSTLRLTRVVNVPQEFGTLEAAATGMPSSAKGAKVSPEILAKLVNAAWANAAAQPGYQGLPYSATQPITASDVTAWESENPAAMPTVGDLMLPAIEAGKTVVPISPTVVVTVPSTDPGTGGGSEPAPGTTTNVNVVNTPTVRVDWGPEPNIGTPSLEATPTAQMILSPLLNLMPSLRNFVVPSHSSVCPKPSLQLFAKSVVMETHCTVLDGVKPTLYAVMAFVWLLIGTLIILRA